MAQIYILDYIVMLAPRKTLWSTPTSAVDAISSLSELTPTDKVYDLGCGDCRVLIHLAKTTKCKHFVGVEIDADRAEEARQNVLRENLCPSIHIDIKCENALETEFDDATVVFLYLVPRGLALIYPRLMDVADKRKKECKDLRVVTYMSQLKNEKYSKMLKCSVDHQPLAAWPIYMYHFSNIEK